MKSQWRDFVLYASLSIVGVSSLYLLVGVKTTGFETKTLWDWLVLLLIPLILAGSALFLGFSQRTNEREMEERRAKLDREMETNRQQEVALQESLKRMTDLLLNKKLRTAKQRKCGTLPER